MVTIEAEAESILRDVDSRTEAFTQLWAEYDEALARQVGYLASGQGPHQGRCHRASWYCMGLGAMSLALGKPDDLALEYFRRAARYGLRMMREPGSTQGLRVVDVELEISRDGKTTVVSEKPRKPVTYSGKPSVIAYGAAMVAVTAFGTPDELQAMAAFGPDDYQSEDLIEDRGAKPSHVGIRALLRGHDEEARRLLRRTLRYGATPSLAAYLAIAEGDAAAFARHLRARLEAHDRAARDEPASPQLIVCANALGLCRLAASVGIASREEPYLPLRLLEPLPTRTVAPMPPPTLWSRLRRYWDR